MSDQHFERVIATVNEFFVKTWDNSKLEAQTICGFRIRYRKFEIVAKYKFKNVKFVIVPRD